jgi:CRISPR/Cas system-associated exonuclease Cas4 (RecB family)
MAPELKYEHYAFSDILGWSISRYEVFDKCKRQYYYQYYSRYAEGVPRYKIGQLKELTSFPLEVGNVVHDVMEDFLKRLQKSDSNIDENRFFEFAVAKTREYFQSKTFIESYYNGQTVDTDRAAAAVAICVKNFMGSPIYNWIFMKAITNRNNWMIEPGGYGETRLNGLKAYCKMDFLFPVDNQIIIIDWKTGRKDTYKHSQQLIGYAAATSANFHIAANTIFPKIVYLSPQFEEFEIKLGENAFADFYKRIKQQTEEMYGLCQNVEKNIPLPIASFPKNPSASICPYCNFQELCFPEKKYPINSCDPKKE